MDRKEIMVDLKDVNLYVRYVQLVDGDGERYYLPWRILYDNFLIYVIQGSIILKFENRDIRIDENEMCIVPPFLKTRFVMMDGVYCQYYGAHFDFFYDNSEIFNEDVYIPENMGYDKTDIIEMPEDGALIGRNVYNLKNIDIPEKMRIADSIGFKELFAKLLGAYTAKSFGHELMTKAIMYEVLYRIIADINKASEIGFEDMSAVYRYVKSIANSYGNDIDIIKMAVDFGMTPTRFRSVFKMVTSKTPKEYIIENKMNHARKLLESGQYNVSEVAYMLGYDDIFYFSKLFKRKIGKSPKNFIKPKRADFSA
jgi:AraC-like DNA-binding protein